MLIVSVPLCFSITVGQHWQSDRATCVSQEIFRDGKAQSVYPLGVEANHMHCSSI